MAKRAGGLDSLYPDGDAFECNYELSSAIGKALQILGYFELPDDEQPDQSIWNHPDKLEAWWEQVKENRDNPSKNNNRVEWENVDLEQNELTKGLRG